MSPHNRLRTPASDADFIEKSRETRRQRSNLANATAGDRCRNRIVEWLCAAMMINFGVTTFVTPQTLIEGSFRYITALGVESDTFAASCLIAGLVRVFALYFNGWGLPWSARVRALCAIFGAMVFGVMGLSLVYLTKDTSTLSLGVGTHFFLAAVELYSCLRAGADVVENSRRELVRDSIKSNVRRDDPTDGA